MIVNIKGVHFLFKYTCNDSRNKHFLNERSTFSKKLSGISCLEPSDQVGMDKRNRTTSDTDVGVIRHEVLNC